MGTTIEVTNAPGTAPYSGRTFRVYVVRKGEVLRYGKPADRDTVELYDAAHAETYRGGGPARPKRAGQFVADYHVETLQGMKPGLGLCLHGGVAEWSLDAPALAQVLAAVRRPVYASDRMAEAIADTRQFVAEAHPERLQRLERATWHMAGALFPDLIDEEMRREWLARCGFGG